MRVLGVAEATNVGRTVRGTLTFDERVWWRLVSLAEDRGVMAAELVNEICANYVGVDAGVDPVLGLWRSGLADREIAHELGWTNNAVAVRRRVLKLPANLKPRGGREVA